MTLEEAVEQGLTRSEYEKAVILEMHTKALGRTAALIHANRTYCPECGHVRKESHAPGCLFPAMMDQAGAIVTMKD